MQQNTISIHFNDTDIPPFLKRKLSSLGIHTTDDLLTFLSVRFDTYVNSSTKEILNLFHSRLRFLKDSESLNLRFGAKSRLHMGRLIDHHKSRVCEAMFVFFHSRTSDTSQALDGDVEDVIELGDRLNTDFIIPVESLFLSCLPTSNNLRMTAVEDVILDLEDELLEVFSSESISDIEPSDRDRLTLEILERSDWPSETPIYVSSEFAAAYPQIVTQLVRKAVLVLKGV
jgi:hypothetical protein